MSKLIVEVGMPLDKNLMYYHDKLISHGLKLVFSCITHDLYFTKEDLNGLTENQIKNACIRIRYTETLTNIKKKRNTDEKLNLKKEKKLLEEGFVLAFDTIKFDFQYQKDGMANRVQLQDIKDIGLICYYDNAEYYDLPLEKQRNLLLNELNSYGFDFKETDLGIDKLRTLFYGKKMFSMNQNA